MAKLYTRKRGKTWSYSFEATPALDGKRKRCEKGGFATEKEALLAGTKEMASFLHGDRSMVSERLTVEDFLNQWLERKKMEVRPGTGELYRSIATRIIHILGNRCVQDLRPLDVDNMVRQLAKNGLSHGTLSVTLTVFRTALSDAVYPFNIISTNPALCIKIPKNTPRNIVKRVVIRKEKLDELLAAFPFGHKYHALIMVAYYTGMRVGEILGLSWDCVDLAKASIQVKRQITRTKDTGYRFSPPKTRTSVREIPIGEELVSFLRRWKAQQAANEMQHGKAYLYIYEAEDGGLWQMQKQLHPEKGMLRRPMVCTQENGKLVRLSTFLSALSQHGVNTHSFRHTHATLCAENGAPPKGLAGRLGHSNTAITENLYTHETDSMKETTLQAFENYMKKTCSVGK